MQPIDVALAFRRTRRRNQRALSVSLDEVLDDRARFGDGQIAVGDDGRLPERMHAQELRRREARLRIARIPLDLVRDTQLLEEPEDAMGARVLEVVEGQHAYAVTAALRCATGGARNASIAVSIPPRACGTP